jgi:hypothetical protein
VHDRRDRLTRRLDRLADSFSRLRQLDRAIVHHPRARARAAPGFDLVSDRAAATPLAGAHCQTFFRACLDEGLILMAPTRVESIRRWSSLKTRRLGLRRSIAPPDARTRVETCHRAGRLAGAS